MLSSVLDNDGHNVSSLGQGGSSYKCIHPHTMTTHAQSHIDVHACGQDSSVCCNDVTYAEVKVQPSSFCLSAWGAGGYVHGYKCTLSRQSPVQRSFGLTLLYFGPKFILENQKSHVYSRSVVSVLLQQTIFVLFWPYGSTRLRKVNVCGQARDKSLKQDQ